MTPCTLLVLVHIQSRLHRKSVGEPGVRFVPDGADGGRDLILAPIVAVNIERTVEAQRWDRRGIEMGPSRHRDGTVEAQRWDKVEAGEEGRGVSGGGLAWGRGGGGSGDAGTERWRR
ncbi:hypothetical protein K504DRAFT_212121 [Pleomassaria siparia CBS 279.74]|uniref:Uncharacterized protein n=1 Tax=Pleomassaria siparia CBS 279.74 TaxID=1314801 RepID=A0A6G1KIQ8_9PLEO|nr:hypothetical protein K504DRAFT_212121 [Pleomassaria siparia CBS 279.74]